MRIVIFEDEPDNAERLIYLLKQCLPDITSVTTIPSVAEGISWFAENGDAAELLFMDIQLSDGNCFEIFEKVNSRVPVIFTTAYDRFALQAFKLYSVDYLLKPIDANELKRAIQKFEDLRQSPFKLAPVSKIREEFYRREDARFVGKINNQLVYVKAKNIAYIYMEGGIIRAMTQEGQKVPLNFSLDRLEKSLDRVLFFRINRKMIVHIDAIQKITTYYNNRLVLQLNPSGNTDNVISRERVNSFKNWLGGNDIPE